MAIKHNLGFGSGKIVENDDGSAGYIAPASFSQAFRVQIADVTGFSTSKGSKALERTLNVLGNGTTLASTSVNHGVSEKIEEWFRAHPLFGVSAGVPASPSASSMGDELRKLAELHSAGILTDSEFAASKARLLG